MAFAGTKSGNGSTGTNPFLTEKELVRQVASNMTKEALVVTKTGEEGNTEKLKVVTDSRRLMAENTAKVIKVWYSFVKFVKNQVTVNGRMVDTTLIGLFAKDENGDVIYLPSPDFLDAGKFKLQKGTDSVITKLGLQEGTTDLLEHYSKAYQDKLQVSLGSYPLQKDAFCGVCGVTVQYANSDLLF